jgi:hypothetical protein
VTIPFDSDASRTAVTVAAQRIAAYADKHGIPIDPTQCEELAENLVHVYQAFSAGTQLARQQHDTGVEPPGL